MAEAGTDRRLRVFRDPASVAVVGASADRAKWGYWLAAGALRGAHRREVSLVNHRAQQLFGRPCAPGLAALDRVPELVALCVPAPHVASVVEEGLALGVRGFLGITAGIPGEPELAGRIRAGGARLVGANSLGIYDGAAELELAWGRFTPGPLAIVSQSGQLGSELALLGARVGLGVSRFVSIGNQSDVSATEVLADLADHEPTRVVALYVESFAGADGLFDAVAALRAAGKPTLLLTVGGGEASSRLARSHTGSLTSRMDVVDAACRRFGVPRVESPAELVDLARACLAGDPPAGRRVAIIGDSGGQAGIAADLAGAAGLTVPVFGDALDRELAQALPTGAATGNPVDLAGAGEQDLASYANTVDRVLAADAVDAAVLTGYFGRYAADVPELADAERTVARRLGALARRRGKPLLVHSMADPGTTTEELWRAGAPTFGDIRSTLRALAGLAALRPHLPDPPAPTHPTEALTHTDRRSHTPCSPCVSAKACVSVPDALASDALGTDALGTDALGTDALGTDALGTGALGAGALGLAVAGGVGPAGGVPDGYWAAREALSAYGVPFPAGLPVRTESDLLNATGTLRGPMVLKAGWLEHKTEAGGVVLGLTGAEALEAFRKMRAELGDGEYVLEEQDRRPDVVEILIGARRDPGFGPVVVVGAGGTRAEVWADTAVELTPVGPATARAMLDRLRCAALLAGWRGRPPTDRDGLAQTIAAVSRFVAANQEITELELNPVRVGPDGVLAVDALIISRGRDAT